MFHLTNFGLNLQTTVNITLVRLFRCFFCFYKKSGNDNIALFPDEKCKVNHDKICKKNFKSLQLSVMFRTHNAL